MKNLGDEPLMKLQDILQAREDMPLHLQHLQNLAIGGGYRRG